jgi:methylthioribose-1-phosphate isomerase
MRYFPVMTENKIQKIDPPVPVVQWVGDADTGCLRLLDQTLLPLETSFMDCRTAEQVHDAIKRLVVRGAPAIGVAAAYGMILACREMEKPRAAEYLESARPTAVNLSWAVRRVMAEAENPGQMLDLAREIHAQDERMCMSIGHNAAGLLEKHCENGGVLTHCNAGALATAGIGTATAGMYVAHSRGLRFTVYCDETRPLLQGSRLTAWELQKAGIEAVVLTDSMAGALLVSGRVGMVIVGADRIAANGDAANKIGTYGLAVLASRHDVPFYVAAPQSTFDLSLSDGGGIPIEMREGDEITRGFGRQTAPDGIGTWSPAFDVTPAELITAIVTDLGILSPVNEQGVRDLITCDPRR